MTRPITDDDRIHIVTSADGNYAQPLCVMVLSLLTNTSSPKDIALHVFDGGLKREDKDELDRIVRDFGANVDYIDTRNMRKYDTLPVNGHVTRAAYYRISIPEIFRKHDKILYLDSDIVVRGDIRGLYNEDVSGYAIGAIGDSGGFRYKHIGLVDKRYYFNSGVLLFNIHHWMEHGISEKINEFISSDGKVVEMHDQDVFNAILWKSWKRLPRKYNTQPLMFRASLLQRYFDKDKKYLNEGDKKLLDEAVINHFSTRYKPWQAICFHPAWPEYYKYLKLTKWSDYERPKKSLTDFPRLLYYWLARTIVKIFIKRHMFDLLGIKKMTSHDRKTHAK